MECGTVQQWHQGAAVVAVCEDADHRRRSDPGTGLQSPGGAVAQQHRPADHQQAAPVQQLSDPAADEGAGAAGQAQRAREVLQIRCRAHRARLGEAAAHRHRRVAGTAAEGGRGGPVKDHLS